MPNIIASTLHSSFLTKRSITTLCADFVAGFCRHGDKCKKSHEMCRILEAESDCEAPVLNCRPNMLSIQPRIRTNERSFEQDGPGDLSNLGSRHNNDHVNIQDISILPTTDEILCRRHPFMPMKDRHVQNQRPGGQTRHIDLNFRQFRYEHTESIIDICYHASQLLNQFSSDPPIYEYDERRETPQGRRYSLFRDMEIVELNFDERNGIVVRVSFSCPPNLRKHHLRGSGHFEKGMLAALIGIDQDCASLSTTFFEVSLCQSTEAMKPRTGNELRASVLLHFADRQDTEAVRRVLYNLQGLLSEKFILVEFPGVLFAGFYFCLKQLQELSKKEEGFAFSSLIAPSTASSSPVSSPPKYAKEDCFSFNCNVLQSPERLEKLLGLYLKPNMVAKNERHMKEFIEVLKQKTTLDGGQAAALCENLCRGLAFTQGPPGTGKTYLGVALAKVILASRTPLGRKPIVAVCLTNHALDAFLGDLRDAGVSKLARIGRGSKEIWIKPYQVSELTQHMNTTSNERYRQKSAHINAEALTREGVGWCEALNMEFTSWPAVREHLKTNYANAFNSFVGLESIDESKLSDIRLARKAGGFAFEYWCRGGDIEDIDQLLECFSTILGNNDSPGGMDSVEEERATKSVLASITINLDRTLSSRSKDDVWSLSLEERRHVWKKWKEEVNPWIIIDQIAEIHRRHQLAITRKKSILQQADARCLEQQDVIGLTTTAFAINWSMLNQIGIQTVLCEEAGEVMEAHTLCTLLPSVEHAIFIGDPLQLRPQVNEQSLSLETPYGKQYRLDESLFERMMFPASPGVRPLPTSRLNIQRRMHPDIADIMRATLYPFLVDHECTYLHPPVAGMVERLWWLDHQKPEDRPDPRSAMAKSYSNAFEVEMVIGLVRYLVNTNEFNFNDIAILTPYNGQLAAFTQRLSSTCSVWLSDQDRENLISGGFLTEEEAQFGIKADVTVSSMLRLATIDNFQGEEAKVIILSTVRSNHGDKVGFLKTSNRINVACSRARNGFYIIGNAALMGGVEMWHDIVSLLKKKSKIGGTFQTCCSRHPEHTCTVESPEDFEQIPTCDVPCGSRLPCGHSCIERCHPKSLHSRMACRQPCLKVHEGCGHQCTKSCGERCGDCSHKLQSIELSCGHVHSATCAEIHGEKKIVCDFKLGSILLDCGHYFERLCSSTDQRPTCQARCHVTLECGHPCPGRCDDCQWANTHAPCSQMCKKKQICGHECAAVCHSGSCPPCQLPCRKSCEHGSCSRPCSHVCDPCVKPCSWACEHQGPCPTICSLPCGRLPCNEPCTQLLPCGHLCSGLCGEFCSKNCTHCRDGSAPRKLQMHLKCGHSFDLEIMDTHVGLRNVYEIDGKGIIKRPQISSATQRFDTKPCCPQCGKSCTDMRRYAIFKQLQELPDTVDRLYAKMGRKMDMFNHSMLNCRDDLQASFQTFRRSLKPGPLAGNANARLVRERGNAMMEVQQSIVNFRDAVVVKSESNLAHLAKFLGNAEVLSVSNLPFQIRLDSLYYRCRLITLEESHRMCELLELFGKNSQHMSTLFHGLQQMTIHQALQNTELIKSSISVCEARDFKRLEVELRLVQLSFHAILLDNGNRGTLDINSCLGRVQEMCVQFPDTAGIFLPFYQSLNKRIREGKYPTKDLYNRENREFWRLWGRYELGQIEYCRYGHPYSTSIFPDCPECGREVERRQNETVDYRKFLYEDAFVEHLLKMSVNQAARGGEMIHAT